MQIPLNRDAAEPLYLQIVHFINQQISAGNLPPGSLLPSIRAIADRHGVSKTIVSMAYSELQAQGLVEGRVGQGTIVVAAGRPVHRSVYMLPELSSTAAVTFDFIRQAVNSDAINLSTNAPSPNHLPLREFNRCLRTVLSEDIAGAFRYESAEGCGSLRQAIARHLMDRGIVATSEEIIITNGAQQAISLVIGELVKSGECVAVESPCYMGVLDVCAGYGVRVIPIPIAGGGLNIEVVEDVFKRMRPRLLYTMPTFQNPTGITLDLARRHHLIDLAAKYDVTILEDGVCSELQLFGQAPPALHALGGPVIHCGSFSKSLLPGLRLGYAVAAPALIRRLALLKQASDIASSGLLQRALTHFLAGGHFDPHLRRILSVYRQRRHATLEALRTHMPEGVEWSEPDGGLGVWVRCPPQVDTLTLYIDAQASGVNFAPGKVFFAANAPSHYLRLSYGAETPKRIEQGIAALAALVRNHMRRQTGYRAIM